MKIVKNTQYAIKSDLQPVELFPPNDHCGWYGLVIRPWWMPKWMAWMLRNHLTIYLGWLNMPSCKVPYDDPKNERWWWIYPTGNNFPPSEEYDRGIKERVEPFLWCELEYVGRVVDIHGNTLRESQI